ncbi:MAG: hypothetical protein IRY85_11895 [Micromonosporaceae bacterium]|nr:hypothetical protein [Micromonosporaceae bacterium]
MAELVEGVETPAPPEPANLPEPENLPEPTNSPRPANRVGGWLTVALRVLAGVLGVAGVNVVLVLIAVPIGLATGQLFWTVLGTELALLAACALAAVTVAVRARRGLGPGLLLGWAVSYVGLVGVVVALLIVAIVVVAVAWLVMAILYGLGWMLQ